MSLKDTWKNKTDGVDDVLAEDINGIAEAVIDLEENGGSGSNGKSPYIGDNGNWYEWNDIQQGYVDTGVKAKGEDGHTPQRGIDYWTDADKAEMLQELEPTIVTELDNDTLLLNHNQMARLGTLTNLILSVPTEIPQYYESEFSFTAGSTISIVYSATPIQWRGEDCDDPYDFYPQANKSYEVSVKYLGNDTNGSPILVARVGVF